MLTQERHSKILSILKDKGAISVTDLTEMLDTSESTIRRDLVVLSNLGKLNRVHGGATAAKESIVTLEPNVHDKMKRNVDEKERIAKYCASLITDDDFIYLDAGTTTLILAEVIKPTKATFVTNGIDHAKILVKKGIKTYVLGGELKATTEAIIGIVASNHLQNYNFSKAFIGANGISVRQGYTTTDAEEACLKAAAIKRSFVSYILADSSKFRKVSTVTFASLDSSCIVTDVLDDPEILKHTVVKEVAEDDLHNNF